jgi:uncharacterized protein YbjT (DUF2867 family)
MKLKVIITGVTGMVGEGVMLEALKHPDIESVLVINRKECGVTHPKLKEIIHADFFDISAIENQLAGYNACFFCLGVTSMGKKEPEYFTLTHTLTYNFAKSLSRLNPDMTFGYISGSGTDSSEKGRIMWARVKGRTENDLAKLPFKKVYSFRPGFLKPIAGQKNIKGYYWLAFLYPVLRALFPKYVSTLEELGLAMINSVLIGYDKPVLEVRDIVELGRK